MNEYICGWKQSQIAQNTMKEGVIDEYKEDSTWVINWSIAMHVRSRSVTEKYLVSLIFTKKILGYSCLAHCNTRMNNTWENSAKKDENAGQKIIAIWKRTMYSKNLWTSKPRAHTQGYFVSQSHTARFRDDTEVIEITSRRHLGNILSRKPPGWH